MSDNVIIKSAFFGGFNKEEVLKYIEKIQSEHIAEIDRFKQKDEEKEQAFQKIKELEGQIVSERSRFAALTALNDEYCERIYGLEEKQKDLNNSELKSELKS